MCSEEAGDNVKIHGVSMNRLKPFVVTYSVTYPFSFSLAPECWWFPFHLASCPMELLSAHPLPSAAIASSRYLLSRARKYGFHHQQTSHCIFRADVFYCTCGLWFVWHRWREGIVVTDTGLLVVLFEILVLRKNTGDILSSSKLSNRIFGKMWLIVGMKCHGNEAEIRSLPFRWLLAANRI